MPRTGIGRILKLSGQSFAGDPRRIGDIVHELVARKGLVRQLSGAARVKAWRQAVGEPLVQQTSVGPVRRGRLEVTVASSVVAQELTYRKPTILQVLGTLLPDETIADLRIRIGAVPNAEDGSP